MLKKISKLKILDKVLLLTGVFLIIGLVVYVVVTKRPDRHYLVAKGYHGWVTIKYEKSGASPLPLENGALMIYISDSGYSETSDRFLKGWGKDEFFTWKGDKIEKIEEIKIEGEKRKGKIHRRLSEYQNWDHVIIQMAPYSDTTLFDGTEISREDTTVQVSGSRKVLQHFYLSEDFEEEYYKPVEMSERRKKYE